jgi:hypothetical protein
VGVAAYIEPPRPRPRCLRLAYCVACCVVAAAAPVAHAGATALGLIRCTNPHTVTYIGITAITPSTHHQGGFGVNKAHGAWGLGGPSPGFPSHQPALAASSARAW